MKRNIYIHILLFSGILLLCSCIKEVNADLDQLSGRPVLTGLLRADTTLSVHITRSKPVLGPDAQGAFDKIPDAQVWVYENGVQKALSYNSVRNRYESSWKTVPGRNYRIQAEIPGFSDPIYAADELLPQPVAIQSFKADTFANTFYLIVDLRFTDPPQSGDFYHVVLYKRCYNNGIVAFETPMNINYDLENPLGVNTNTSSYANVNYKDISFYNGFAFSDAEMNGKEIRFTFPVDQSSNSCNPGEGELYVELRRCSPAYYQYITTLSDYQESKGNPFSNPVQIYDNIVNGNGIWGTYSFYSKTFSL